MRKMPSKLVAIASYGTAQDHYLERVVREYRKLKMSCRVVVLSERKKSVEGAEVLVGLPTRNPYSLPFAHRKLFAENAERYDLFIYTEDDTLLTEKHLEAFLAIQPKLEENEILGLLRSETTPGGEKYITSVNHHFRWLPNTVVERGGDIFAQLSNQHSGCFIATRQQLQKAIASGGFLVEPRSRIYGMLETAASDIYTQCGLRRLICLSRIKDFIVPHLANKYYSQMGIPAGELELQIQTLCALHRNGGWRGSLFDPQTNAPEFRWSKNLYEKAEDELLETIPSSTKRLLSIGAASGENEVYLAGNGIDVWAMPFDSVFADALRRRGIRTVDGPFDKAIEALAGESFDVILMVDVLHHLENPVDWLQKLRNLLLPDGHLIASVGNTSDMLSWIKDWRDGNRRSLTPDYETIGVQPVSARRLRRWCKSSGLKVTQVIPLITGSRHLVRRFGFRLLKSVVATELILKAKPIL
jgi:2-polyprenyl-3-methyl-5-hydroxy-6-metoxy-1,4-benzoquinol methylase